MRETYELKLSRRIKDACVSTLACSTTSMLKIDDKHDSRQDKYEIRKRWGQHFPKAMVEELLSVLEEAAPHCNKGAAAIMHEILSRRHLWLDREASPRKWSEFAELVKKLLSLPTYIY